ncbi:MAG: hypothetical protein FWC65_04530, partial [Treponema sp.]|nr:hypothetical protein [Treponema sp.]
NSGTYRIVYEYGIPFIHFDWDAQNSRSQRIIGERFLMLRKDQWMLLYDGNAEPAFRAFHGSAMILTPAPLANVRASSTLTHGGLHFAATPDRLGTHINRVWAVEGGVGERLYFEEMWGHQLALSIGYVHYSRPYLFQANSRPKRLRISSTDGETSFEVELEDTPHYQVINLHGRWWEDGRIIIEILEVRPGFRYNHMCINSIMLLEFTGI